MRSSQQAPDRRCSGTASGGGGRNSAYNLDGSRNDRLRELPEVQSVVRRQTSGFRLPVEQRAKSFDPDDRTVCPGGYFNGTLHVMGWLTAQNLFHVVNDNLLRLMSQVVLDAYVSPELLYLPRAQLEGFQGRDKEALPHMQLLKTAIPRSFTPRSASGMCFRRVVWGGGAWLVYAHVLGRLRLESADLLREVALLGHAPPDPFAYTYNRAGRPVPRSNSVAGHPTGRSGRQLRQIESRRNDRGGREGAAGGRGKYVYLNTNNNNGTTLRRGKEQPDHDVDDDDADDAADDDGNLAEGWERGRCGERRLQRRKDAPGMQLAAANKKRAAAMLAFRNSRPSTSRAGREIEAGIEMGGGGGGGAMGGRLAVSVCAHCAYLTSSRCPSSRTPGTPRASNTSAGVAGGPVLSSLLSAAALTLSDTLTRATATATAVLGSASSFPSASPDDNTAAAVDTDQLCARQTIATEHQQQLERPLNIVLYTRGSSGVGRSMAGETHIAEALRGLGARVEICCDFRAPGGVSLELLLGYATHADVVMGLHGAGLMNAVFARRGVMTVELKTQYGYALDLFALVTVEGRLGTHIELNVRNYARPGGLKPVDAALVRRVQHALLQVLATKGQQELQQAMLWRQEQQQQRERAGTARAVAVGGGGGPDGGRMVVGLGDSLGLLEYLGGTGKGKGKGKGGDMVLHPHPAAVAYATSPRAQIGALPAAVPLAVGPGTGAGAVQATQTGATLFEYQQWGHVLGPAGGDPDMRRHCLQLQPFEQYWEAIKANKKEYCKPCPGPSTGNKL